MPYFIDNDLALNLVGAPNTGFRPGQLGALHSSLAHFSVYDEPAILSLPTGYGKTALLMALPFLLRAVRVLVVEPSDALRRQTTGHFKELSVLRRLRVLDEATPNPKVHSQKGAPADAAEWLKLAEQDLVISTPQSLSPVVAPQAPPDLFDVIIFDEAHHAPAETWAAFLAHYPDAKFVFLTATPFRRDRKVIPGRMAYYYPVSKAAKESAFGRVTFTPAPVRNENDDEEIDRSVARTAVARLRADQANGFDHRIFARAATIASARRLVEVYAEAGARVRTIDSHASKRAQDTAEAELLAGEIDGVVCVDMFGEGYDFPKLKIAALHAPHRSLVPTLQFIGRFARTNDAATGDATLVAPISRLKAASLKLFKEGIDVAELIDEVARAQIADAEADREVLDLLKISKQADSDYDSVTPLLLELYAHAQIFECYAQPDFSQFGDTIGRDLRVVKQWSSEDGLISLLLTVDTSPPSWATSDVLVNVRHDVFLLAYNEASHLCFIGSTRRTARIYQDLIQTALPDQHRPISYERTRRALSGLNNLRFYNVGLRNTAVNSQAESYRVMTGPAAERAITSGDARAYSQGHFFGSGVGGDDVRETIGASSSSRIWSNQRLTVAEYIEWITGLNGRLGGGGGISASQLDIIQHARTLRQLPERIIAAGWHKQAYRLAQRIRWRNHAGEPWSYGNITDLELANWQVDVTRSAMTFNVASDTFNESFRFGIDGGALFTKVGAKDVEIHTGYDEWSDLASWLSEHPPVFYAADKSSFVGVNLIAAATAVVSQLRDGDAEALGWDNCKIDLEFGPDQPDGRLSVHRWLERYLMAVPYTIALVYDHRSGEAADYIAVVKNPNGTVVVRLYHCKGAGGVPSGGRVNDVYEVSGQMLKSITYCDAAVLVQHIEHRINAGRHRNPSRFAIGDLQILKQTLEEAPPTGLTFEVFGVQPGISKAAVNAHLADLMIYGLDYAQRGGASRAQWLISA
ncbi:DEAD/DEAH box helicase family protein [Phyllobacterium sp. 0TCS1.6C]|uniref:DEAD/DEAH box helicase n=1 Tax=unclassified Phyllobacterium TaxID=2638441 RepID=UPI0022642694|nr:MULTISPECIES: DEAD/DEAH box helicase family protein [unclassified Phyllobacterium]MCX8281523.1 DEAD/DEAH box helicase family protein [Phyllobacterium sp. 0TCS1.6C]MCX8292881.1 DEAD/DEAH box helicase family protein [Phyllobacterium sp. 0TCS1.6A]